MINEQSLTETKPALFNNSVKKEEADQMSTLSDELELVVPFESITSIALLKDFLNANYEKYPRQCSLYAGLSLTSTSETFPKIINSMATSFADDLDKFIQWLSVDRWSLFWDKYWALEGQDGLDTLHKMMETTTVRLKTASMVKNAPLPLLDAISKIVPTAVSIEGAQIKKMLKFLLDSTFWPGIAMEHNPQDLFEVLPAVRHPLQTAIPHRTLESAYSSLRMALDLYSSRLHKIFLGLLRHSPPVKEYILGYFDELLYDNLARAKMVLTAEQIQEHPRIQHDGAAMMLWWLMLRLAEPFTSDKAKQALVTEEYFSKGSEKKLLIEWVRSDKCTKLLQEDEKDQRSKGEKSQQLCSSSSSSSLSPVTNFNFITECFHWLMFATRLGPVRLLLEVQNGEREAHHLEQDIARLERQINSSSSASLDPQQMIMTKYTLSKMKAHQAMLTDRRIVYFLYLSDLKGVLGPLVITVNLLISWLTNTLPKLASSMPEMTTLELISEVGVCLSSRYPPHMNIFSNESSFGCIISGTGVDGCSAKPLIEFSARALRWGPEYIKSPYHRAKLVEILLSFAKDARNKHYMDYGLGTSMPTSNVEIMSSLVPSLLKLYDEVERTGSSTQFYEKFNQRFLISSLLSTLWTGFPSHKQAMTRLATSDGESGELFLRFSNLMINDLTYLLDEALEKIGLLNNSFTQSEGSSEHSSESNARNESIARSCLQLAGESLVLLDLLTTQITGPFIRPELQDRLPAMLLLNMRTILNVKHPVVNNPEFWKPRLLIKDMLSIFEHMSSEVRFIRAACLDARSFRPGILRECADYVGLQLEQSDQGTRVRQLDDRLTRVHSRLTSDKSGTGEGVLLENEDIPDEFLDPITFTLMQNPVKLLTSNTILDASTLKAHMLNDKHDPFNRAPIDEQKHVMPCTELAEKIKTWLNRRT